MKSDQKTREIPEGQSDAELLQRFFDREISGAEAEMLMERWSVCPKSIQDAKTCFQTETLLQLSACTLLLPEAGDLQKLKNSALHKYGLAHLESERMLFDDDDAGLSGLRDVDRSLIANICIESSSIRSDAETTSKEKPDTRAKQPTPYRALSRRDRIVTGILFVCFLAIGLIASYNEFRPYADSSIGANSHHGIAKIGRVADPVFFDRYDVFKKGQVLEQNEIRLKSGIVELVFENNARVVLEGPVIFSLLSDKKTFCEFGRVCAEIPKEAVGFEVLTPFMGVRDLGTEFMVEVDSDKAAAHVIKGEIAFDKLDHHWIPIEEGTGRIVRQDKIDKMIAADKDSYISGAKMLKAAVAYESRCMDHWQIRNVRWQNDPDILFHLDFSGTQPEWKEQTGIVGMAGIKPSAGRWLNRNAVAVFRKQDAVALSSPKHCESFTLMASICLDKLSSGSNVVFSANNFGNDILCWQINPDASVQLSLLKQWGKETKNFKSPPARELSHVGTWIHLATVLDADKQTVTHYVDGRVVVELPFSERKKQPFVEAELGNMRHAERTATERQLHGQIDEFILLGRALSAKEVMDSVSN